MNVQKSASLHEKAVQKVARGDVKLPKRTRTRSGKSDLKQITVNPEVWKTAKELAEGDCLRLEVLGPESVMVHNNRSWRSRRG